MAEIRLDGKVVVVAGANGRLGQFLIPELANRGARVAALVGTPEAAEQVKFPQGAPRWAVDLDATEETQVQAAFSKIKSDFGRIYAMVNIIGMWNARPFGATSFDDWNEVIAVNLHTTFLTFREGVKLMGEGPGRLIAMAAGQGMKGGLAKQAAYSASKAAVMRLVESVAQEYRGTGITAHAIAPSTILFDESSEAGVKVSSIVESILYLCGPGGMAHNGATLPAYGSMI